MLKAASALTTTVTAVVVERHHEAVPDIGQELVPLDDADEVLEGGPAREVA